jgi:hypothetical protein
MSDRSTCSRPSADAGGWAQDRGRAVSQTDKEFADILIKLRQLNPDDLEGKLVIGGFVDHPYGPDKQRCMECMYFLVHRKWCDLPELAVPVEPEWWCRLWRI